MSRPEDVSWEFGSFRLDTAQRLLFRNGELVPLSRKAVEILILLTERQGQLVEKEELMRTVWPDAFVEESNVAVHISQLRKTLGSEDGYRIDTIPRRGYRFVGPSPTRDLNLKPPAVPATAIQPLEESLNTPSASPTSSEPSGITPPVSKRWLLAVLAAILIVGAGVFTVVHYRRPPLTQTATPPTAPPPARHAIVLSGITNNTGDPVFDVTLHEAIAIQLEQSPYLSLIPEARLQQSLKLMGKPADTPMTPDLARELCQRNDGQALIDGWIAKLGTQYVIGVRAVNCRTGDHISDLQVTAAAKELVLKALGDITGQLRTRLGESLSTVQRFDTPIEEATTSSLEALQAYSIGRQMMVQKGEPAACIPFFEKAIRADPSFAVAYAALGNAYSNLDESDMAATNIRKAYELRAHVSEHERLYIESHYYQFVTGDLIKASEVYETWAATYPNDEAPRTNLAAIYSEMGKFDRSLQFAREAVDLSAHDGQTYANLVNAYVTLNKPDEANAIARQAQSENRDSSTLRLYLYDAAYLQNDYAEMQRQMNWASGEPGVEGAFLDDQANVLATSGQVQQARELTERATEAAKRADEKETAAGYRVSEAQREALFGNETQARKAAEAALSLAQDRDTQYGAALALVFSGDSQRAQKIAAKLDKDYPNDTFVQYLYLPIIRSVAALNAKDPIGAIRSLEPASAYELGVEAGLFPAYIRGLAYLRAGDAPRAISEFQKILGHPGVVLNGPIGPLARLQMARAYAAQGNLSQSKAAYDDFLSKWKNADPDLPVLREAIQEYSNRWGAQALN
jgi:DNA-binding winged helix-turn-helix (wHTH) protein/predicted Zn-dependent protease